MSSFFGWLNRLLPFATPGTPFTQDILHLAVICIALYYAPQLQERLQNPRQGSNDDTADEAATEHAEPSSQGVDEDQQANEDLPQAEDGGQAEGVAGAANPLEPFEDAQDPIQEGQAGPAREPIVPTHRDVGAKKAKALARRDQRRAYNEFQRSQGDAQRARDAEGAQEREAAMQAERERREAAEAALEAKKAKEREQRRQTAETERFTEQRRRGQVVELVRERLDRTNTCDLFQVAREVEVDDEEWVEKILKASGMLGRKGDVITMITSMGWAVRVSSDNMQRLYQTTLEGQSKAGDGVFEHGELSHGLEVILRG